MASDKTHCSLGLNCQKERRASTQLSILFHWERKHELEAMDRTTIRVCGQSTLIIHFHVRTGANQTVWKFVFMIAYAATHMKYANFKHVKVHDINTLNFTAFDTCTPLSSALLHAELAWNCKVSVACRVYMSMEW